MTRATHIITLTVKLNPVRGNNLYFLIEISAPEPVPIKKIKEEPKPQRVVETKRPVAKQTYREEYKKVEPTVQLESYYYGILPRESNNDSGAPVSFNVKVNFNNRVVNE